MACLLGCLGLAFPRITIVLLVIFSDYIGHAYASILVPFMGFLVMPFSTLAYAFAMNANHGTVDGFYLVVVVLAVLADIGNTSNFNLTRLWRCRRR